jgi:hypothetical protein
MSGIQERKCSCWRKQHICYFCMDCQKCGGDCHCDDDRRPGGKPRPWPAGGRVKRVRELEDA